MIEPKKLSEEECKEVCQEITFSMRGRPATLMLFQTVLQHIAALEQENAKRIRHINRLASWAQQDPTGPLPDWLGSKVQAWVLNELKSALGGESQPQPWRPECAALEEHDPRIRSLLQHITDLQSKLTEALAAIGVLRKLVYSHFENVPDGFCIEAHFTAEDATEIRRAFTTPAEAGELVKDKEHYMELIMAVETKWPNESRYETALRYIKERERSTCQDDAMEKDK